MGDGGLTYVATLASKSMVPKACRDIQMLGCCSGGRVVLTSKLMFTSETSAPLSRILELRSVERIGAVLAYLEWDGDVATLDDLTRALQTPAVLASCGRAATARAALRTQRHPSTAGASFKVFVRKRSGALLSHTTNAIARAVGASLADLTSRGVPLDGDAGGSGDDASFHEGKSAWRVDLQAPDLHVAVWLDGGAALVAVELAKQIVTEGGVTCKGLDPVVAWALARSAEPGRADILFDPMCGRGICLLEAHKVSPGTVVLGADADAGRVGEAAANRTPHAAPIELMVSSAVRMPLRAGCVDCIVCDLPFGKEYGSVDANRSFYPRVLEEARRVVRPGVGRAVLLTNVDNEATMEAHVAGQAFWRIRCKRPLLLGRMRSLIYVLGQSPSNAPEQQASAKQGQPTVAGILDWEAGGRGKVRWHKLRRLERPGMEPI